MPLSAQRLFCGLFVVESKAGGRNSCKSLGKNFSIGGDNVSDKSQMAWLLPFLSGLTYFKLKRSHSLLSQDDKRRSQWIFATLWVGKRGKIPEDNLSTTRPSHAVTEVRTDIFDYSWDFSKFFYSYKFPRTRALLWGNIRLVAVDELRWISRLSLLHWKGNGVLW